MQVPGYEAKICVSSRMNARRNTRFMCMIACIILLMTITLEYCLTHDESIIAVGESTGLLGGELMERSRPLSPLPKWSNPEGDKPLPTV